MPGCNYMTSITLVNKLTFISERYRLSSGIRHGHAMAPRNATCQQRKCLICVVKKCANNWKIWKMPMNHCRFRQR